MRIKVIPYNTTEYGSLSAFPGTGESGKYYLALDTMILYVWSSNAYTAASFRYEGKPTYHGSYLKSGYLEFTMAASPAPIDWHSGDYIRYNRTGRVYKMYNVPQTERQSGTNHNGDSFAYRNVQFYDSVKELELTPFRDYVQGQNQYFFSSKQDVQTTEPVSGIVARLNANLTDYFGSGVWNVTIAENIPSSFEVDVAKDYSVSGTCLDALNAIYETWNELGWGFSVVNGVNTITIGYPNVAPATSGNRTNVFSYGSGLTALKRNTGSLNDFCTRMHVFGTERNLINRYYNGKDIYNAASVYIPNLMIPLEHWGTTSSKPDASKAYIEDQSKIDLYGLITKDVYFDGTDGKPEVYPSIEEQTIEVLKAAKTTLGKTGAGAPDYYPQTNDDTIRVDAVKSIVTMPVDDGSLSSSGSRYIDTYDATISSPIVNGQSRTSRSAGETTLYEYTFDDSGIVDVKWEGALKFVLNQALGANDYLVLRLCIYKGSVTRSNRLSAIEFSKVSDVTNGQILSLDITKAIGTREEQFTGKIILTLEYYFVVSGGGTRTITITKEGDVTTSVGLREALASTFKVKTQQIGFDISKMTSSGGASLALKSGMCAGREFPITSAVYNSSDDSWTLTCKRTQDNSTEIYYPNAQFPIAADELFVILGITMPEEYILAQSERLYALGQELYNRVSVYKPSYEPSIDSKQVLANITAHPSDEQYKLIEGKYMRLYDTDIISGDHSAEVLITELTIGEGDAEIATYRVVLSDKATVSGGITRSIANISNEVQQMQSAQRSAMRGFDESEGGGTIPDGGTNVNPVFIKDGVPQAVDGIDVQDDIHTGSAISADGNLSVGGNADIDGNANIDGNATIGGDADVDGNITSEHGDIQALAGGVSANGIADLSQSGSGGAGTVTDVKVNNASQPQSDGTVSITLADVALSGNYNDLNNKPTIADAIKFDANVSYQETTPFTPINGLISLPAYNTWAQLLPSGGIPLADLASVVQTSLGKADTSVQPSDLIPIIAALGSQASQIYDVVMGKQDVILDLEDIRTASTSAYQKPYTGIPKSDLENSVQTSLGKADTALQSHQTIYTLTVKKNSVETVGTFNAATSAATIDITDVASAATVSSHIGNTNNPHSVQILIDGKQIKATNGTAITVPYASEAGALELSADVGSANLPVYFHSSDGLPHAISGLIVPNDIQSTAGGVSANGIADLAMVSGGGAGTVTAIKIGSVEVTDVTDGVVTIASNGTFNASSNPLATVQSITDKINLLDGIISGSAGAGKTLTALSQTNGVISATFGDISISSSQINNFPSSGSGLLKWNGSAWSFDSSSYITGITATMVNNAYGFTITGTAGATYALATISSNASNGNTAYGYFSGGKLKSANIDLATGDNNGQVKIAGTNVSVKGLGSFAYISSLAFSGLSSHPTTISGYGITDAYTETDVDASISTLSASIGSIKASLGSIAYRESDEFASYYDFNVVRNYFDINGNANNANLLSGLPIHTGRNNEINKIVRTDSSGYIQAGWINTTSGNFTGTPDRIYASNDGYIRYMTPANLYENTKQTISDTLKLQSITGALGEHEAQIRDLGDGIMSNSNRIWLLEDFFTHGGSIYGTVSINNGGLSVTGATTLGNGVNCIGASGQNDLYLMRTNGANYIHIPSGTDLSFDHRTYGSSSSTVRMTILSNGGVSFTGAIAASGAATLGSTLSVSGAATFASTITASGNITSSAGVAAGGIADLSMN